MDRRRWLSLAESRSSRATKQPPVPIRPACPRHQVAGSSCYRSRLPQAADRHVELVPLAGRQADGQASGPAGARALAPAVQGGCDSLLEGFDVGGERTGHGAALAGSRLVVVGGRNGRLDDFATAIPHAVSLRRLRGARPQFACRGLRAFGAPPGRLVGLKG